MKTEEAYNLITPYVHSAECVLAESTQKNKGANGMALEKILGIKPGTKQLDFEDGELKTFSINEKGQVKEDFRICSIWEKDYIKKKLENILVVGRNLAGQIVYCKILRILEENPIFKEYFDKEVDWIISKGPMNCSQKDTEIWVSKTQGKGGEAKKTRSLYISRPASHYLFFGVYPPRAQKAKAILA